MICLRPQFCLLALIAVRLAVTNGCAADEATAWRTRVTQEIAAKNWAAAQRVIMEWRTHEPDNPVALLAQSELFEAQGYDELAYAVVASAVGTNASPAPIATTSDESPASVARVGEHRIEPPPALWTAYRRLQTKVFHTDDAPSPAAGKPAATAARPEASAAAPAPQSAPPSVGVPVSSTASPAWPIAPAGPQDTEFAREPHGQWANRVEASSAYRDTDWNPAQAAGAPNVAAYGDSKLAWCPKLAEAPEEWLKLTYATPVHATAVRVRQNLNPGTVVKVEVFSADGQSQVVWSGRDPTPYTANQIGWFTATFNPPPFLVQSTTLTLNTASVPDWNEIDAVQLVGEP